MKTAFAVIGFMVMALIVGTCVACNDDNDSNSSSPAVVQVASHDYDGGGYDDGGDCDWRGDCGGQDYDQNYGSRDDRNRNRNRNRGSFSPGPFDRSPVTITICAVPDSCPQNPPPDERR